MAIQANKESTMNIQHEIEFWKIMAEAALELGYIDEFERIHDGEWLNAIERQWNQEACEKENDYDQESDIVGVADCAQIGTGGYHSNAYYDGDSCNWCGSKAH